jgi:imidazolonepropionase-like amidohydrolase
VPAPAGPVSYIRDVSVVDVAGGQITPHQDSVIRGGLISAVRPATTPVKGSRFVIPGLWDMHVHLWYAQPQFPLFVANGVTGVRDMGSDLKRIRAWQSEIAKGALPGPRIYASGPVLSTEAAADDAALPVNVVNTPDEARRVFNRYYDQHVDFIKIIDLPEPAFEALAEASRHGGLPFAGHLPDSVSAFTAAQDRMVSMEHLFGIGLACSSQESELRKRRLAAREAKDKDALTQIATETMDTYDPFVAKALWDLFRRYEVRQTPTLTLWRRMTGVDIQSETADPSLRYVQASIRKTWEEPKAGSAFSQRQYEFARKLTAEMAKANVPILAGTDTGDPWTVPGATLQDELGLLVEAGLTPAQALRAATLEPARLMHKQSSLGEVKKGYAADLVVLAANPLEDIANTRRIETVVVRGKQLDKAAITRMLMQTAAAAGKS